MSEDAIGTMLQTRLASAETLDDLATILLALLESGSYVGDDGHLVHGRKVVDRLGELVIEVRPRDHVRPHFHVRSGNIKASIAIDPFEILRGDLKGERRRLFEWWLEGGRGRLLKAWADTRAGDVAVGNSGPGRPRPA